MDFPSVFAAVAKVSRAKISPEKETKIIGDDAIHDGKTCRGRLGLSTFLHVATWPSTGSTPEAVSRESMRVARFQYCGTGHRATALLYRNPATDYRGAFANQRRLVNSTGNGAVALKWLSCP